MISYFFLFVLLFLTVISAHLTCAQQSHADWSTPSQPIQWFCNSYVLLSERSTFESYIALHFAYLFDLLITLWDNFFIFIFTRQVFNWGSWWNQSHAKIFFVNLWLICNTFIGEKLGRIIVIFINIFRFITMIDKKPSRTASIWPTNFSRSIISFFFLAGVPKLLSCGE